jgi:hypothetical protein
LKLLITTRTRSGLVKVTLAIPVTSTSGTDRITICVRRDVITDPGRAPHDPQQPIALIIRDLPDPQAFSGDHHLRSDGHSRPINVRGHHSELGDLHGERWL